MMAAAAFFTAASPLYAQTPGLEPHQESYAYKQYSMRPKSELSKLSYLLDRYKGSAYKVIFDGSEYDSAKALRYAKGYLARHYRRENAVEWLRVHAYRSPAGQVIYLKSPEGETTILRDALIKELEVIGG